MNDIQPLVGLYYPFIQFRSDSWIKTAALYWDRLGRIVPEAASPDDSEVVRNLRGEIDFVADLRPTHHRVWNLSARFEDLIENRGPELRRRYGVDRMASAETPYDHPPWSNPVSSWSNAGHGASTPVLVSSNRSGTEGAGGVRWRLDLARTRCGSTPGLPDN
jgi:hypothetical protein